MVTIAYKKQHKFVYDAYAIVQKNSTCEFTQYLFELKIVYLHVTAVQNTNTYAINHYKHTAWKITKKRFPVLFAHYETKVDWKFKITFVTKYIGTLMFEIMIIILFNAANKW